MTRAAVIAAVWLGVAACELPGKSLGVATHGDESAVEGAVACDATPPVFPTFARTCADDGECRLVFHQVDCCGSRAAIGIAVDEVEAFADAEAMCVADHGACRCLAMPTTAEQGGASDDEADIRVACVDLECQSFVAP